MIKAVKSPEEIADRCFKTKFHTWDDHPGGSHISRQLIAGIIQEDRQQIFEYMCKEFQRKNMQHVADLINNYKFEFCRNSPTKR